MFLNTFDPLERIVLHSCGRLRSVALFIFFFFLFMGQYFKAVNLDKREYVCPWCIGGDAKFLDWFGSRQGAIWNLLLRQSSATGSGDIGNKPIVVNFDSSDAENREKQMQDALKYAMSCHGRTMRLNEDSIVGRWAGDRITLIGNYDDSRLWDELPDYRNISREVVQEWNHYARSDDMLLEYNEQCCRYAC